MFRRAWDRYGTFVVFTLASVYLLWRAPELNLLVSNPDHGYQISLGHLVMQGRFPFVDMVFVYGPLAAFMSAAGIWLSGSLVAEVVMCATLYAVAVAVLYILAREVFGSVLGLVIPLLALLLLARFDKWYVGFFPAMMLYCLSRASSSKNAISFWWGCAGVVGGLAALLRMEYGIVLFSCAAVMCGLSTWRAGCFRRSFALLTSGFMMAFGCWLVVLFAVGGFTSLITYFDVTLFGSIGTASNWSIPPPRFDWTDPWGPRSAHALALLLMPTVYLGSIAVGIEDWRYELTKERRRSSFFLISVGLVGLATFPHALYRADTAHLLQDFPPALLAAPALIRRTWQSSKEQVRWWRTLGLTLCIGLSAAMVISIRGMISFGAKDLGPLTSDPISKYRSIAAEDLSQESGSRAFIAREIRAATEATDPILIIAYAPQLYFFSHRPMSGLLNIYFIGIHDEPRWRKWNLASIRANPPRLVVSKTEFDSMPPDFPFRRSQPELFEFLRTRYRTAVFRKGNLVVLAQNR
jgi:hypothetical protein